MFPLRTAIDSLEPRTLFAGITLVTHGLESTFPTWVDRMAEDVARRIDPQGASTWANVSHYRMQVTNPSAPVVTTFTRTEGPAPNVSSTGEIVISLDWVPVDSLSGPSTGTIAQAVANALFAAGPSLGFGGELMELPIHLLGHSRGGSLITALAADLGVKGAWVDQLSPLEGARPVELKLYRGGHMMYLRPTSRRAFTEDARSFYRSVLKGP